jgi:glutathione S-transferase
MKLYYSMNLNPRVAVTVAKHLKTPLEYIPASPRDPAHEEAFRAINPNTLVPVLVEEQGTLWETDAIACRLSVLAKSDFFATGKFLPETLQWISWGTHHFTGAGGTFYTENIIRRKYFSRPVDVRALEAARADFHRYAKVLDDVLAGRTWLVDNRLTYADFRVATALPFAEEAQLPVADYRNIIRWHERLNILDAWRDPLNS